jgi:26S proteasome regulatory subunit N11
MEVMGLMLGEFVDDYTVRVVDVFAMPQSGTGVSVEAVDPVFQTKMLDMLKQVGRYALRGAEENRGRPALLLRRCLAPP